MLTMAASWLSQWTTLNLAELWANNDKLMNSKSCKNRWRSEFWKIITIYRSRAATTLAVCTRIHCQLWLVIWGESRKKIKTSRSKENRDSSTARRWRQRSRSRTESTQRWWVSRLAILNSSFRWTTTTRTTGRLILQCISRSFPHKPNSASLIQRISRSRYNQERFQAIVIKRATTATLLWIRNRQVNWSRLKQRQGEVQITMYHSKFKT